MNQARNGEDAINKHPNPDGANNYVIVDAEGRGHYVGVTHSIQQNQGDWWGEGDEMIFVDGARAPNIIGTGSEDYYLGAWCYGGCGINPFGGTRPTFAYGEYGNPMNGGDDRGAKWMVYRFHPESPIVFQENLKVTIEHGHANHRSDNFFTVGIGTRRSRTKRFPRFQRWLIAFLVNSTWAARRWAPSSGSPVSSQGLRKGAIPARHRPPRPRSKECR